MKLIHAEIIYHVLIGEFAVGGQPTKDGHTHSTIELDTEKE